jgi:hypothetical protein
MWLQVNFVGGLKGGGRFGMTVEVDPEDILGRVKVEVCEREGIDPRTKYVIRGSSKEDGYVLGSQSKRPDSEWRLDPRLSFKENTVSEGGLLLVADNPALTAICPICHEPQEPLERPWLDSPFHTSDRIEAKYRCDECDWHWKVTCRENGMVMTEDERFFLIIGAPALKRNTFQRSLTSGAKIGVVLESVLQQYGIRKADREGLDRDRFRLQLKGKTLDNQATFASLGIHYSAHIDLIKESWHQYQCSPTTTILNV